MSAEASQRELAFFGRITASVTHEIKNELAVMNEQSRLIQELLQMARQGGALDPARLEELIGRVIVRIERADQVVRLLNTFAHSADQPQRRVEAGRVLELMTALGRRPARLKGVDLTLQAPEQEVSLTTSPFLLEEAWFCCLDACLACLDGDAGLTAGLRPGPPGGVEFWFRSDRPLAPPREAGPPPALLSDLEASLELEDGVLLLRVADQAG